MQPYFVYASEDLEYDRIQDSIIKSSNTENNNDQSSSLEEKLSNNDNNIEKKKYLKLRDEQSNLLYKLINTVPGGTPFVGSFFEVALNEIFIDENKPQDKFDHNTQDNFKKLIDLYEAYPDDFAEITKASVKLKKESKKHAIDLDTHNILYVYEKLKDMGADKDERIGNLLEKINTAAEERSKLNSDLKSGININQTKLKELNGTISQLANNFDNLIITEIMLQATNTKNLPKEITYQLKNSIEKLKRSKDENGNINDQKLYDEGLKETNAAKLALDLFNSREVIQIGGLKFDHITDQKMHSFTEGVGVAYYTIQSLQHLSQLTNNPKLQQAINDSMQLTHSMTVAFHSFSSLTSNIGAIAAAGAVSAGIGAVVGIITMLGSKKSESQQKKAFEAIFKQLKTILEVSHKIYKLQIESYKDLQYIKFQNEVIKNRIFEVQTFLVSLHDNQYTLNSDLKTQLDQLSNKIDQSSDKHNFDYLEDTLKEIFTKFNDFIDKYTDLLSEKKEAIALGKFDSETLDKINKYEYDLPKKTDQVVSFLLVNEEEIDHSLNSRLRFDGFNTLFKLSLSHLQSAREDSQPKREDHFNKYSINTRYNTPYNLENNKLDFRNLYKLKTEHFFDHLHTMYNNTLSDSNISYSDDGVQFMYQDLTDQSKEKNHQILDPNIFNLKRSNYLLFNILHHLYNELQNFKFNGKKISENAINIINKRIDESIEIQKAYRSILPVAINRFTNQINSFTQKIKIQDNKSTESLLPIVKVINNLNAEIREIEKSLESKKHVLSHDFANDRYYRERNSKHQYGKPEQGYPKVMKFNFVSKNSVTFNQFRQGLFGLYEVDIRTNKIISNPQQLIRRKNKKSPNLREKPTYSKVVTQFDAIDVNKLGLKVENLATKYGLINRVQSVVKKSEKVDLLDSDGPIIQGFFRLANYVWRSQVKEYKSYYRILKSDLTKHLELKSNTDYNFSTKQFPGNETKVSDLIYLGHNHGTYTPKFRDHNDLDIILNANRNKHLKKNGKIHILTNLYTFKKDRQTVVKLKPAEIRLPEKHYIYPHQMKSYRENPLIHYKSVPFDILYAQQIDDGVMYNFKMLKTLSFYMTKDLSELMKAAGTKDARLLNNLNLSKSYYKKMGIDLNKTYETLKYDFAQIEDQRLAWYHFLKAGFQGCQNKLFFTNYMIHQNKLAPQKEVKDNLPPEKIFSNHEVPTVFKYTEKYLPSLDLTYGNNINKISNLKNINFSEAYFNNILYPWIKASQSILDPSVIIKEINNKKDLKCGSIAIKAVTSPDRESVIIKESPFTLKQKFKKMNIVK